MNGMIHRAIERFVRDTYGRDSWLTLIRKQGTDFTEFEPMLSYPPELAGVLIDDLSHCLEKPTSELLEDIGTYLVSHPTMEPFRRLMRFSGHDFSTLLASLEELPGRARLAFEDLVLPALELEDQGGGRLLLHVNSGQLGLDGFGYVCAGILRAMADDYGDLVLLDYAGAQDGIETIEMTLAAARFNAGRDFQLAAGNENT